VVVSQAIIEALEGMDLRYPKVDDSKRKELKALRATLSNEAA